MSKEGARLTDERIAVVGHELRKLEETSGRFRMLDVTEDEFIYMKSIVLFKPGKYVMAIFHECYILVYSSMLKVRQAK